MPQDDGDGANVAVADLYKILSLPVPQTRAQQDAFNNDALKKAYRKALLRWHPDKLVKASNDKHRAIDDSFADDKAPYTVDEITLAFEVLSDPKQRRQIDDELLNRNSDSSINAKSRHRTTELDVVDLDDMAYDESNEHWSMRCRCGNQEGFIIAADELQELAAHVEASTGEVLLACTDCSHHIKVLYAVGDDEVR